ncbi:MAG: H+transporting two-sector ATPase C subunit [Magnetococcales bacterium]|nr:H+transporting two-sector ATPase C subunit [Magnetococcales bacterium]NGZ27568.1 H+transporting two-sector ATPase C subunit [Magnetococcales bacterium]
MSAKLKLTLFLTFFTALLAVGLGWAVLHGGDALAAAAATPANASGGDVGLAYLAAALATGLSSIAAGIAVASIGSAAIGAILEKPEMLGRILILVGLGEGIAIYGLIISIMILNRVG